MFFFPEVIESLVDGVPIPDAVSKKSVVLLSLTLF